MTRLSGISLCLAFILAFLTVSARAQTNPFDHEVLAQQFLERHVRPGYAALGKAADAFEETAKAACGPAPGAALETLKPPFRKLVLAWSRVEHIRFGPVMQKKRHARMLYWPDRKGLGRKQVAKAVRKRDRTVADAASLAAKSVALQGLGALEFLLYGPGAANIDKPGASRMHRCAYILAVAANVSRIAAEIEADWDGDGAYAGVFLSPGPENPAYLEPAEVTFEIAKSFLTGLARLRDIRIAGPLGLQRGKARRARAAFESSRLSSEAIAATLEGLVSLYEKGGLRERIERHEAGMGGAIHNDLVQPLEVLHSIKMPMKEAAADPEVEDKLIAIGFPLKNAREQATRVLAQAAGLSLGFNALDGD